MAKTELEARLERLKRELAQQDEDFRALQDAVDMDRLRELAEQTAAEPQPQPSASLPTHLTLLRA